MRSLCFTSLFCILTCGYSQNQELKPSSKKEKEWILRSILKDQAHIWTSPLRISKKDLAIVLPVLALAASSIAFDEEIYTNFKKFQSKNKLVNNVSPIITYMGDDKTFIGASTLFLVSGAVFDNEKSKRTALLGYQTFIHAGIVIQVIKHLASRQRPSVENGKDKWNGPASMFKRYTESFSKYDAFPSGHTIMAWGLAAVISHQYRNYTWVPIASYTLATAAGLSRVTEDTHWFSDVIIGGSIGYAIGRYVTRKHQNTNWTLLPQFGKNNATATMVYRF